MGQIFLQEKSNFAVLQIRDHTHTVWVVSFCEATTEIF